MMKFLKNIFHWKRSQNVEVISNDEKICRFSSHKKKVSTDRNELKYTAFLPPPNDPDKISVLRIDTLNEEKIWKVGDVLLKRVPPKYRGNMIVEDIRAIENQNLDVVHEPTPHYLHANIINIPANVANDPDEKARQTLVAMELARRTTLLKRQ